MTTQACSWIVSREQQFIDCNCRQPATQKIDGRWWCDFHATAVQAFPNAVEGEILGRVSTKEQADHGYSMPTQVEESIRYAIQNRIRILPERVFIEDTSGVTPIASRPQGQKAIALLEQ